MTDPAPKFTLRQLELFQATIREGTFAAAAKSLFLTPAAVAVAVTDLENSLGVQLVIRQRARGVTPTSAGNHLLERARRLLSDAAEIERTLSSHGGEISGPISVGCYTTLSATILPSLIDGFTRAYPKVQLRLTDGPLDDLAQELLDGKLDVVIGYRLNLPAGLEMETLYETEVHALLSTEHPLADADEISLSQLADDPLILLDLPPSGRHTLDLLHRAGVTPKVAYSSPNFEFVRSMVARNHGYSLLIQKAHLNRSYENLPLVSKHIQSSGASEWAVVCWPQGVQLTDRAQAFVNFARDTVGQNISRIARASDQPKPAP